MPRVSRFRRIRRRRRRLGNRRRVMFRRRRRIGFTRRNMRNFNPIMFKVRVAVGAYIAGTQTLTQYLGINLNGDPASSTASQAVVVYSGSNGLTVGAGFPWAQSYMLPYESFRIAACKISYMPFYPPGSTSKFATNGLSSGIVTWDYDGLSDSINSAIYGDLIQGIGKQRHFVYYRRWNMFFRAPRYRLGTKIPSTVLAADVSTKNIAGQWHPVFTSIGDATDTNGCHIQIHSQAFPDIEEDIDIGQFIITLYVVCKDRGEKFPA